MTTAEGLNAAADKLERDGWQQGAYGPPEGPNCVAGAIMEVASHSRGSGNLLARHVGENLTVWNDAPGQTAENVIATLREVARQA